MAYQRSLDNFRETLLEGGFSAEEVKALKSEVVSSGYIPSAKEMVKERKEEEAAWQDYREGERGGDDEKVAAWLAAEEARKAEETQAGLLAYYQGRKAGETSLSDIACTSDNIQKPKPLWQKIGDWIAENASTVNDVFGGIREAGITLLAGNQLESAYRGTQQIIKGPQSAREVLEMNPHTNNIGIQNTSKIYTPIGARTMVVSRMGGF